MKIYSFNACMRKEDTIAKCTFLEVRNSSREIEGNKYKREKQWKKKIQ